MTHIKDKKCSQFKNLYQDLQIFFYESLLDYDKALSELEYSKELESKSDKFKKLLDAITLLNKKEYSHQSRRNFDFHSEDIPIQKVYENNDEFVFRSVEYVHKLGEKKYLFFTHTGEIIFHNEQTQMSFEFSGAYNVYGFTVLPDGKVLAHSNKEIFLFEINERDNKFELVQKIDLDPRDNIAKIHVDSHNTIIIAQKNFTLWKTTYENFHRIDENIEPFGAISFAFGKNEIATISEFDDDLAIMGDKSGAFHFLSRENSKYEVRGEPITGLHSSEIKNIFHIGEKKAITIDNGGIVKLIDFTDIFSVQELSSVNIKDYIIENTQVEFGVADSFINDENEICIVLSGYGNQRAVCKILNNSLEFSGKGLFQTDLNEEIRSCHLTHQGDYVLGTSVGNIFDSQS